MIRTGIDAYMDLLWSLTVKKLDMIPPRLFKLSLSIVTWIGVWHAEWAKAHFFFSGTGSWLIVHRLLISL